MIEGNTLFGVGFDRYQINYLDYEPNKTEQQIAGLGGTYVAHNSYLQIWAECGTPSLVMYLSLILLSFIDIWGIRKRARQRYNSSWILSYCTMFEASIAGFMVGSFFLNRAHFDLIYHFVALILVFGRIAREEMDGIVQDQNTSNAPRVGGALTAISSPGFNRRSRRTGGFRNTPLLGGGLDDMCGFSGVALDAVGNVVDRELLKRMTRTLVHRGPDDEGLFVHGSQALGFRRLSIIDLEGGHQPILNETGDVAVCVNGEIYNFKELRADLESKGHVFRTHSDAETVVHLYEEKGARLAEDLVGMFAFCVFDWREPNRPKVLLGRDRLGIKPLYWGEADGDLYFGSEPKALLASESFGRQFRRQALLDYLVQGYCSGRDSAWQGIHRLTAGHVLEWSGTGTGRMTKYWDLPNDGIGARRRTMRCWSGWTASSTTASSRTCPSARFYRAVWIAPRSSPAWPRTAPTRSSLVRLDFRRRATTSSRPPAVRRRAWALRTTRGSSIPTPGSRSKPCRGSTMSRTPTRPRFPPTSFRARRGSTSPWRCPEMGGDEVFAGYRRYVHDVAENRVRSAVGRPGRQMAAIGGRLYPKMDWAPRILRARTFLENVGADPARAYWNSVSQLSRSAALELLAPDMRRALPRPRPVRCVRRALPRPQNVDPLYRAQYADFHTDLTDRILSKVDRASMAVSLEVRVPILDHRFVERFANLPTSEKVQGSRGKHRLREALRSRLSGEVLDGKKRGFDTPLTAWLRGPLAEPVAEAIQTLPSDWFDRNVLEQRLAEHRSGRHDHGRLLWSLLVLEHWRRRHEVTGIAA